METIPAELLPPLPRLSIDHTPGWRLRVQRFDRDSAVLTVFDSDMAAFNLGFTLDVFSDGDVSSSLGPREASWSWPT